MSPESQVPSSESESPSPRPPGGLRGDTDSGLGTRDSGLHQANAAILRRTLSAISALYALWNGLVGMMAVALRGSSTAVVDPRFILLHAAVLGLAGTMQWRPMRGSLLCTAAAAAGSIGFVLLDLRRGSIESAVVDGLYVPVAALLLYFSRPRA